jgi:hypothetical protein
MTMRLTIAILLAASIWPAQASENLVIHAGEQAVIEFRFDAPPLAENGEPVNFLVLSVGGSYVNFTGDSRLVQTLHDGAVALATREVGRGGGLAAMFVAEDNPFNGITMDFSSVQDGSIHGRLVVRPVFDPTLEQARIRFSGQLISGHLVDGSPLSPGPTAEIIGCQIEAPIFRDRFSADPLAPPPGLGHRDCELGRG